MIKNNPTLIKNSVDATRDYWFTEVLSHNIGYLKNEYSDSNFPDLFDKQDNYIIPKLPFLEVKDFDLPGITYSEKYRVGDYPGKTDSTNDPVLPVNRTFNSDNTNTFGATGLSFTENSSNTSLIYDSQLNEYRVRTEQLGNNIKKFGRLRGNMHYLEDLWDIEIRPIVFKWIYLDNNNNIQKSKPIEMRHRDKYIKIKIRYTGEDLAIIQGIQTMYDLSYA